MKYEGIDTEPILGMVKQPRQNPNDLEGWERVPFPSVNHSSLGCVYTVD